MKLRMFITVSLLVALQVFPEIVFGHRPYIDLPLGAKESPVLVRDPQISRAYYRQLDGEPEQFEIVSETPFFLHVNILEPYSAEARRDFKVQIFVEGVSLAVLDGANESWSRFEEPWGGDDYWMGPKFEAQVKAGGYLVVVSNPDNRGKYSLAVGAIDSFPPAEILRTLLVLPTVKSKFFGKPAWTAYFNYTGIFLVSVFAVVAAVLYGFYRLLN